MAITVKTQVTQLYVALFMRAPDVDGLNHWAGEVTSGAKTIAQVAQDMYNTSPARTYYPAGATDTAVITAFYTNVLGRAPDAAGLAHWLGELAKTGATKGSVISDILSAVVNWAPTGDAAIDALGTASQKLFNNKVVVAEYYAEVMLGGVSGASNAISGVTATSDVSSNAAIAAIITGGTVTGQLFTLTNATNGKLAVLTSGNDTVDAGTNVNTSSGATVSDGSVTDSDILNAKITINSTPTLIANVETINLDVAGFALNFDATNVSYGSTGGTKINVATSQVGNNQATISGLSTKNVNVVVGSGITDLTLGGTANTNDAAKLTLNGGVSSLTATSGTGIENLAVVSSGGSANIVTLVANSGSGNIITVTGDQNLTIKSAGNAATGIQSVQLVKGTDYAKTLVLDVTSATSGALLNNVVVDKIVLSAAIGGSNTVTFANNANVSLNLASALNSGTVALAQTVTGTSTSTGTLSTLNLSVDKASGVASGDAFTFAKDVTVLNFTANQNIGSGSGTGGAAALTFDGLSGTSTQTTLNLSGTGNVNISAATTNAAATDKLIVNASSLTTGSLYLLGLGSGASGTLQVIGSNQADIITISTGNTGAVTVLGGSGNDIIVTSTASSADRILGDAGNDTISLGSGADTIYGGDGSDSFVLASGAATGSTIKDFVVGTDKLVLTGAGLLLDVTKLFLDSTGAIQQSSGTTATGFSGVALQNNEIALANAVAGTGDDWSASIQLGSGTGSLTYDIGTGTSAIKAGSSNDNISVTNTSGTRTISLGAGDDRITLTGADSTSGVVTITAGSGNDTIVLTTIATSGSGSKATLVFDATAAGNGVDTITGFGAASGGSSSGVDKLDFSAFLGSTGLNTVMSGGTTGGTGVFDISSATGSGGSTTANDTYVIYKAGATEFTTAMVATANAGGALTIEDSSKAVVILALGSSTSALGNIYYVSNGAVAGTSDVTITLVGSVSLDGTTTFAGMTAANVA